jgi:two-component system, NarL family, sensor kinase
MKDHPLVQFLVKKKHSLLRILLAFILFTTIAIPPARADITKPGRVSLNDSLLTLDTLVRIYKISNPYLAVHWAKRALVVANQIKTDEAVAQAYILLGISFLQLHKDSSYIFYTQALKISEDAHLAKQKANVLYNLANIYEAADNHKDAITMLDSSILLAESIKDYVVMSNAYNSLGTIKVNIQDFESARQMFQTAFTIAKNDSQYKQMGVALANLARFRKDANESVLLMKEAIGYLKKLKNGKGAEEEIANVLNNIGNKFSNPDSGLYYYRSALKIATYAKLPKIVMAAYNNMAYNYLDKGDVPMAESCLRDYAIPIAQKDKDYDWLSSLHDTYADIAIAQGDYKKAFEMQKKALSERITDNQEKATGQVRLLAALLDLKNKELIIQTERNRLQKTKLWLAIAVLLAVISVFFTLVLQQRNRVRFHKEQIGSARRIIEMEESEKGRIARELHDLTGQLVMGISGSIENIEFSDPGIKEQIKTNIAELGKSIRQISHRMNRAMLEHFTFSEMITGLCEDVQRLSGLSVSLEIPEEFPDLPNELVLHFYRITQELLTNATKYAKESQVKIGVLLENGKLILSYKDNGPGFIMGENGKRSMGLMNIHERAKLVRGHATVKSSPGQGTSWEIIFPVDLKNTVKN